jgi:hypothetical protein
MWHGDGHSFNRLCTPGHRIAILALFTWSEPFIPSKSPLSATTFTDLWICFKRGLATSELGYMVVWWFMERKGWRGGSTMILLARKGQNHLFRSHLVSGDCGEDNVVRSWRSELHRRVRGSHHSRPTSLSIEREGPSSLSPPPRWPNLSLVSSHQNPSHHCQFSPDPDQFQLRSLPLASSASLSCSLVSDMWSAATTDAIFFPVWPTKQ